MINKNIKIVFFTGNRAEFGLMAPIIKEASNDGDIQSKLIVSGVHLCKDYGNTIQEIQNEGIDVDYKITLTESKENEEYISKRSVEIIDKVSKILIKEKPDYFFILGDRYETYAAASAAVFLQIPIAHEGGGTITSGGCIDDVIRHAITKLANLHFVTCKTNYENVKKLGEEEWRICLSGSTAMDTIKNEKILSKNELEKELNLDFTKPIILFTQHPVLSEKDNIKNQIFESLEALKQLGYQTIITFPNSDVGSNDIIEQYYKYKDVKYFKFVKSLGRKRYLSVMKYSSAVVGNSSSGLLETPIFKIPTVNIGSRQYGRVRSNNVIDVSYNRKQIKLAIEKCIYDKDFIEQVKKCDNPFDNGNASLNIINFLKCNYANSKLMKKRLV